MGDRSGIEWTDASWNPVTGCTEVSAGCDNCYAARLARGKLATVYGKRERGWTAGRSSTSTSAAGSTVTGW